jgi:hypothetical protein
MNDFHMSHLATGRIDELRAEADRHRMARTAKPQLDSPKAEHSHHPRRFTLSSLLRRAVA